MEEEDGGGEGTSGGVEGEGISEEASGDVDFDDDEWGGPGWSYEMFAGTPGDEAVAETPRYEEHEVVADAPGTRSGNVSIAKLRKKEGLR